MIGWTRTLTLAVRSLFLHPLRSALTVLGIFIGVAGVIWLLTLLSIDYKRGLGPADELKVDIAALYWHFVDVVWIAIFTLVYLIK